MSKREELLGAVKQREIRDQEDIKRAFEKRRKKRWIAKLISLRLEDINRLEKIRSDILRQGVSVTKSQVVRAGILALQRCDENTIAEILKNLDEVANTPPNTNSI